MTTANPHAILRGDLAMIVEGPDRGKIGVIDTVRRTHPHSADPILLVCPSHGLPVPAKYTCCRVTTLPEKYRTANNVHLNKNKLG